MASPPGRLLVVEEHGTANRRTATVAAQRRFGTQSKRLLAAAVVDASSSSGVADGQHVVAATSASFLCGGAENRRTVRAVVRALWRLKVVSSDAVIRLHHARRPNRARGCERQIGDSRRILASARIVAVITVVRDVDEELMCVEFKVSHVLASIWSRVNECVKVSRGFHVGRRLRSGQVDDLRFVAVGLVLLAVWTTSCWRVRPHDARVRSGRRVRCRS